MSSKSIIIIAATDLSDDNSASLCHTAYIRGFAEAGHKVKVLTVAPTKLRYDHEIDGVQYVYVSDENSLIRRIREKRNSVLHNQSTEKANEPKHCHAFRRIIGKIKRVPYKIIVRLFGATTIWNRCVLKLKFAEKFDIAMSLSSPPESHSIAAKMIKKGIINTAEWCQLWEDPWSTDLYASNSNVYKKEKKLLDAGSKIVYVSPLTLVCQQKLFAQNADKMDWLPLPTYFSASKTTIDSGEFCFGYFGQYFPHVRNLAPTYEALNELKQKFVICGEPHDLFVPTETTEIQARVTPAELKEFEDRTNVLVFISNLGGGQIPGKIYQYSGTDKWILFVLDGNENEKKVLTEYFGQFNRYVFCDNNKDDIMAAVRKIISNQADGISNTQIKYFEAANIANEILTKVL